MSDFKMCPLMIGKEERKAILSGQGDVIVPIIYPCIGERCMAYAGKGNCDYWMRNTMIESVDKEESEE